jgi:hypothetical protein
MFAHLFSPLFDNTSQQITSNPNFLKGFFKWQFDHSDALRTQYRLRDIP